jgi:hypothetical protein
MLGVSLHPDSLHIPKATATDFSCYSPKMVTKNDHNDIKIFALGLPNNVSNSESQN